MQIPERTIFAFQLNGKAAGDDEPKCGAAQCCVASLTLSSTYLNLNLKVLASSASWEHKVTYPVMP
jgi:hypothetical protein